MSESTSYLDMEFMSQAKLLINSMNHKLHGMQLLLLYDPLW
uniref:Uncharacterized protein n=1 Tax=Arundo donax TaxID=35708 RepID=A0A0A9FQ56_ARUDO